MALVAHLRRNVVLLFSRHHQLNLTEAVGHRLFAVDMLAERHCQHGDRKMREIRYGHAHGIDVLVHLVEHLAEILVARHVRKLVEDLARLLGAHVAVA